MISYRAVFLLLDEWCRVLYQLPYKSVDDSAWRWQQRRGGYLVQRDERQRNLKAPTHKPNITNIIGRCGDPN